MSKSVFVAKDRMNVVNPSLHQCINLHKMTCLYKFDRSSTTRCIKEKPRSYEWNKERLTWGTTCPQVYVQNERLLLSTLFLRCHTPKGTHMVSRTLDDDNIYLYD